MKFIKIQKVIVFPLIKVIGKISPFYSTKLSFFFYRKWGMKFIGKPNYISSSVYFDGGDYNLIEIGEGCTISSNVSFLTHDWALNTIIKSMDIKVDGLLGRHKSIVLERNVFIGRGVIILPGVLIGEGTIIGAGSVVRGKIPSYSLVIFSPDR
jgi:acetyltransferase-like isoleucine patch superfamily enzyme